MKGLIGKTPDDSLRGATKERGAKSKNLEVAWGSIKNKTKKHIKRYLPQVKPGHSSRQIRTVSMDFQQACYFLTPHFCTNMAQQLTEKVKYDLN